MINFAGCSEAVRILAIFGGAVLYILIGLIVHYIANKIFDNVSDEFGLALICIVFWPIAVPVFVLAMILYAIGSYLLMPFWVASREDLSRAESRIMDRIDEQCSNPIDVSGDVEVVASKPPFKVGDIITGIVPQTNIEGGVISYKHLYQGCKCRVLSIRESGSMRVVLVDHKDKEAHRTVIGDTFTVPARNFTLVKKKAKKLAKKRKVVKKKVSKRKMSKR